MKKRSNSALMIWDYLGLIKPLEGIEIQSHETGIVEIFSKMKI